MEGPPLKVIAERLAVFKGKKVKSASGTAKIEKEATIGKEVEGVFSRGKNLFIRFADFSFRIHFLMFGSYRINEIKSGAKARLSLAFNDGTLSFYNCPVSILRNDEIEKLYNENIDITSEKWDLEKVMELASKMRNELICDVLLDQNVFAGVGNIIKNEALFLAKVHPLSVVGKIPEEKLKEVALKAREFSLLFYEAKKKGESIDPYLKTYGEKECPACKGKVLRKRTGIRNRISFICPPCQVLYA
nr:hypothetical protein [Candidatus Njordarchaeum guaymaensis]